MKKDLDVCESSLTRRSFLSGVTAAAADVAAMGLVGCSTSDKVDSKEWMPETWDYETDILVIEAGPEGEEGGNTRVSGNLMFIPDKADEAVKYQTALNGGYVVDEELVKAWAEGVVGLREWLTGLGADMVSMPLYAPEFAEIEGSEAVKTYCVNGQFGYQSLWKVLKEQETEFGIEVLYGTRGLKLTSNPITKEVFGLMAEQDGVEKYIKARKGVVLSCGGFEADYDMMRSYYGPGHPNMKTKGTPYNRGDGFRMIQRLGGALKNMSSTVEGAWGVLVAGKDVPLCAEAPGVNNDPFTTKDYIFVGPECKRMGYEENLKRSRHGKIKVDGVWVQQRQPAPAWVIMGKDAFEKSKGDTLFSPFIAGWLMQTGFFEGKTNQDFIDSGIIIKADTIEELAEKCGYGAEVLNNTISTYNGYCAAGVDEEFGRGTAIIDTFGGVSPDTAGVTTSGEAKVVLQPFALAPLNPPFYAVEMVACMNNTHGGPVRGTKGEVIDVDGNAIPRLFAAGEFGCLYSYMYNGGGDVSGALADGRTAVRVVGELTAWDAE